MDLSPGAARMQVLRCKECMMTRMAWLGIVAAGCMVGGCQNPNAYPPPPGAMTQKPMATAQQPKASANPNAGQNTVPGFQTSNQNNPLLPGAGNIQIPGPSPVPNS